METFDWLSDLQPLQAAAQTWQDGSYSKQAVFHLKYESDAPFAVAAGAGLLAEHVRRFRFSPEVIAALGRMTDANRRSVFSESFLNHLQRLRLNAEVFIPQEGMLLVHDEPILIARGAIEQILLLESAFRILVWESTHWATLAALRRWQNNNCHEEDTPRSPQYPANPKGWKIRAQFIGGATADEILEAVNQPTRDIRPDEGLKMVGKVVNLQSPTIQIRRLYNGNVPVGDVLLDEEQNQRASVSRTTLDFIDIKTAEVRKLSITRFQNLYSPVLAKGNPLLISTRKGYFRQRTLHQLEAFSGIDFLRYPSGFAPNW